MLGQQSELNLKQILDIICETEIVIESHRQSICRDPKFSPYSAFCRIDRLALEQISSQDFLSFFKENGACGVGVGDCAKLIRFFDDDLKGSLNFHQFLQIILPCESAALRKSVSNRPYSRVGHFDALPYSLESQLLQLLQTEIDLQKRVQMLVRDLERAPDYSIQAAFRTVDCHNEGFINLANLTHFFKKHGDYLIQNEVYAILRRIDVDGDAKISFNEFRSFFQNHLSPDAQLVPTSKKQVKCRAQSAVKKTKPKHRAKVLETDSQNCNFTKDPQPSHRLMSAKKIQKPINPQSFQVVSQQNANPQSFKYMSKLHECEDKRFGNAFQKETVIQTIHFLLETIQIERNIEHSRHDIIIKPDFNICDAFRMFDTQESGFVSLFEFRDGLCDIGLIVPCDQVELFFTRYDRDGDGLISFSEFTDAFTPIENYYASIIGRRTSSHRRINPYKKDDIFEHHTACQLKNTLRVMFESEYCLEILRETIARNPLFNLEQAFKLCDLNGNGIVSKDELRIVLESHGNRITDQEARNLTSKFDRDFDGLVTWQEFAAEVRPRKVFV